MNPKRVVGLVLLIVTMVLSLGILMSTNAQPTESTKTPIYLPPLRDNPFHPDYNASTFGTYSYDNLNIKENMRGFYSNYTNMFHYWGYMGRQFITHSVTTHNCIGYAFSPDGINWNVNPYFGMNTENRLVDFSTGEGRFDVVLDANGRDFWLVAINEYHSEPYSILGRKGYLLMNGSIRWYAPIQIIHSGYVGASKKPRAPIDAETDSTGRLFVTFNTYVSGPIYVGYVKHTDNTNGYWITTYEVHYDSLLSWNKGDTKPEYLKLNRLADGKMALTGVFDSSGGNVWYAETVFFNGVNWLIDQERRLMNSAASEGYMYKKMDIVSYGDHLIGTYTRRDTGQQRLQVKDGYYNHAWENGTDLVPDYYELTGSHIPHLTVTDEGNAMLFVYTDTGSHINYTYRFSNYTWHLPFETYWWNNSDATYRWNRFTFMDTTENIIPFWFQDNTDAYAELGFHYFSWNGTLLPVIFQHFNTSLLDEFGNSLTGDWIFEGDIYEFRTFMFGEVDYWLNFSDGLHDIQLMFDYSTLEMYIVSGERFVIGEIFTEYTLYDDGTQELVWRFIPDLNIIDITNTTVDYGWYHEGLDLYGSGYTGVYFNIYNLGGLTSYIFIGDGGRTPYGSAFDLYATNGSSGSSATAEQIFRKLQHVNFLMEINMGNEWDAGNGEFDIDAGVGYVDIGIDYRLNSTWIDGFKIRLYVFSADVGHHLGGNDQDWVLWSVDFYNYYPDSGNQQNLQTAYIYSNQWGYERRNFVPDYYINRTSCQLWVDLWFDRTNASTTVATQTNAYYRGMKEQGSAWWFGYGVFTPMIGDYDNAKFLDDLYDEGGNITNVQKYELMKFYITVGKVNDADGNDETWRITAIEDMHRELAIDRMEGIDEPTFVETKIIDMPQTGFVNAIKSAINGLSKLIWGGAFQFVKLLMGAVGSLMEAIGLGEWWIAFNTMVGRLATFSMQLMEQLQIALINSALLLTQIFNLVSAGLGRFIGFFTNSVTAILQWYQGIIDLFTGTGGIFNIDIWRSLGLGDWLMLALHLSPVWWIDRLAKADSIGETAQNDIMFVVWIISGLLNFLITVIALSIELFNFFIGLLPI